MSAAGLHRMAYVEWGDPANPRVLVCVHGLTRCGRDFDDLARALADQYRVVCPDVVGRGLSDRLRVADAYAVPQYASDMVTLIARLDAELVDWVGTSMGGLIGMGLAAQPETPIRRLVLNDVGPVITAASIARICEYLGKAPRFAAIEDAERYVRGVSAGFGNLSDAQWRHLTVHSTRALADGGYEMAYDPAIAQLFAKTMAAGAQDVSIWSLYEAIRSPTLLIRGADSDLLRRDTAEEMTGRGPKARLVEFAGVGHAPMLMDAAQIAAVRDFLLN